MMYDIKDFNDVEKISVYKKRNGQFFSDDIYTFDIETTSLFKIEGEWKLFDKSISKEKYKKYEKRACVYHCQFSVNDKVYCFYEMKNFEIILRKISNPFIRKIIYVHNLGFETGFLQKIMDKYTIKDLVALKSRQPIRFVIEELNLEFRCSMKLTGLGLDASAKQYTSVKKASGDLDYNVNRSPLSARFMTEKEKYYCEMDCVCVYEIIKYYRKKYKHVCNIPLTQTGTVRKALQKVVSKNHIRYIKKLVPSIEEYKVLHDAFMGGITHGNRIWVKKKLKNIHSIDISSSYPFVMCVEKFPCTKFRKINIDYESNYSYENYAKIYKITCKGIRSRYYNNYLSYSKCHSVKNAGVDNGRIFCADELSVTLTDVDYKMLHKCYEIETEILNEVWVARKDYLPKEIINFMLDAYCDKTALKHISGMEEIYNNKKVICNCMYGACVTDLIKSSILYDKGWKTAPLTDELIKEKLDEQTSKTAHNLFAYSWGVFVTAYARRNLFERIIDCKGLDFDVVYYDTDSLKMLNFKKYKKYFEEYNNNCRKKILMVCNHYSISIDKFYPYDKDGICHPLGYYDFEDGDYSEFKTLGAKRYCYRDSKDGDLHITISGVGKDGVKALKNNIDNFNENLKFNYEEACKNTKVYYENVEPYTFTDNLGNKYTDDWGCGVVIMPTTYEMKVNFYFDWLCEMCDSKLETADDYLEIRSKLQGVKKK